MCRPRSAVPDVAIPMSDPAITTVRIVLNLEKMVVKEAKRAFSYLSLFGYVTDAVIVNRLLPANLHDDLFKKWQLIHQRYQAEVESSFEGIPIFNVPLFDSEVEVRFVAEGEKRTRVRLEHRNLDRHGDHWRALRDGYCQRRWMPHYLHRFAGLFGSEA